MIADVWFEIALAKSSSSHRDDCVRAWTNADHRATESAHPRAPTHNRLTHPSIDHDQRYTAAEQQYV